MGFPMPVRMAGKPVRMETYGKVFSQADRLIPHMRIRPLHTVQIDNYIKMVDHEWYDFYHNPLAALTCV